MLIWKMPDLLPRMRKIRMMKHLITRKVFSTIGTCALLLSGAVQPIQACTGIRLSAQDGTVVHARPRNLPLIFTPT